jgi:hypothetical protein
MKYLLTLFFGILALQGTGGYPDLVNFISKQPIPSEQVRRNCAWQYAIVKVQIKDNRIVSYNIENRVSVILKEDFKFLKGYKFPRPVKARELVFFVSFESKRIDNCDVPPVNNHELPEVVYKKYKHRNAQLKKNVVYINNVIYKVIYDPENKKSNK